MAEEEAYSGLVGAYPFALRASDSWLFRSYVLLSAFLGVFVALVLLLALVTWIANPVGLVGERALLGVIALLVLGPLFAPVLFAARRHRLGGGRARDDFLFGAAGYAFVAALYVGLFVSDPSEHALGGALGPVAAALDSLPDAYGLFPPVVGAALVAAVVWLTRERATEA